MRVGKVMTIRRSCLAMEIRGPGRHSSGRDYSWGGANES